MTDPEVDPSDTFDNERAYDWQVGLHERDRLLTDGRHVTPMTPEEFAADWARRKAESAAKQDWDAIYSHSDWNAEPRERKAS